MRSKRIFVIAAAAVVALICSAVLSPVSVRANPAKSTDEAMRVDHAASTLAEIMDAPGEGGIGGTFCGNPVACAAALAVLETFEKDNILEHAKNLGTLLTSKLNDFKERFSFI